MASSMGFITDLPPEIRLDIYEYLLRFHCPLKRIKTIDELDGTLDDEVRQYVRGGRIELGILFACHTTFREALPVFYKLNTVSLCHDDVCLQHFHQRPFRRCDQTLVQSIVVVDWLESEPWTMCEECSSDASSFFANFSPQHFPRLKQVTFDLEGFQGGYDELQEQILLSPKGPDTLTFEFTAVGCLRIKEPTTIPQMNFTFNAIASSWSHFYHMPADDLWTIGADFFPPESFWEEARNDVPGQLGVLVAQMFVLAHNFRRPVHKQYVPATWIRLLRQSGFNPRWVDTDIQTSEDLEMATEFLLDILDGLIEDMEG
ncbi:hypothetical protein KC343_g5515 [Hortaea werneckii]|nr:hypothetical protein KC352_g26488 [Hortaea werneckii]KAI7567955.1 hypothetical protein KC317_g4622 [Hortaea werneckii]KAI7620168.1 hypothetical protein KC346_g4253 [Hortaea werneckii]KAI7628958.1 hypothetical protein KC343_g5515 [Hortaea werneckii]KAI7672160.1 hypothetical protein KC319_g5391 [Hortaea werneckii]